MHEFVTRKITGLFSANSARCFWGRTEHVVEGTVSTSDHLLGQRRRAAKLLVSTADCLPGYFEDTDEATTLGLCCKDVVVSVLEEISCA
jgi:hypothetical protein